MEDENLLRNYKNFSMNKYAQTIATIISNLGYAVFGLLLLSKDNAMILQMLILETCQA